MRPINRREPPRMEHQQHQERERLRSQFMRLSEMIDPIGFREYTLQESGYQTRPHESGDRWGYLYAFMTVYAPESDPQAVIALFEQMGANDDHQAVKMILRNDELVP